MAISSGSGTTGATAVKLCVVPPGPGAIVLSNMGTATPAFVGMGTNLSSANGFPIPASVVPTVIPLFAGNLGGTMYVVTSGASAGAGTIGWLTSSATGQTGTGTLG